jgi:hypothetical protein
VCPHPFQLLAGYTCSIRTSSPKSCLDAKGKAQIIKFNLVPPCRSRGLALRKAEAIIQPCFFLTKEVYYF